MNSKALLLTVMAVLTMSAVSCGKDDIENSVSMSLSESKTTESTTENSTEETTETTTTVSSVTTESGTDTTDVSTTTTDTTTTTTSAETSQPEETPQQEQNEPSDNNNDENQNVQDDSNNNQQDNNQQQDNNNNNDNSGNDIPQDVPQQKEIKFSMDNLLSDASGIISELGNPDYSGQSAACTTNGNDIKIYQYSGLSIQCYIDGDREYICNIEITDSKYQTDKGIKVGSTRSEVEAVYGAGTESGNYIIYSSGNNEMDIQYNGDTVISILFYTPV